MAPPQHHAATFPIVFGEPASAPARARSKLLAGLAIVPMVALTMWAGFTSDHLARPVAESVFRSYMVAALIGVGVYWWVRRPASRFGGLLILTGVLMWIISWQAANAPLLFDLGVLAEAPAFVLSFYLLLAFPMGRLEPRAARWLIGALWVVVLGFFLPWALFTPAIAGAGVLNGCDPACPENVLQIATATELVKVAGDAETYAALTLTAATLIVYGWRVSRASRPQRRALVAVGATSALYLPAYFVATFSAQILHASPATLENMGWAIVAVRVLLPVGFLVALLQADRFAARAQRTLLERLVARPTPAQWRDAVAEALDDSSLRLGFHDPPSRRFVEADGRTLTAEDRRAWVPIHQGRLPVAAMSIDETLGEDPELVRAAASATLLAVENGALEGELRASRAAVLEAGKAERERIGRDLHDSAQQRLIALRIHLALMEERLAGADEERALLERLGEEVDETLDELRAVAQGVAPRELADHGVRAALEAAARRGPVRVTVYDSGIGRPPEAVEAALYFCCLECLQNAAKHAGPDASVAIHLTCGDGRVRFSVQDDGTGFDPTAVRPGAGLGNLASRVAAVGGRLEVEAGEGRGTRVTGELPI